MNLRVTTAIRGPAARNWRPRRNGLALCAMLVFLCAAPPAFAKRAAPAPVTAVSIGPVEYSAPASAMGFVVATDKATRRELWRQRIYDVLRDPGLESDVQDVFIKTLEVLNGRLLIRNERGEVFLLDPATRAVTRKP